MKNKIFPKIFLMLAVIFYGACPAFPENGKSSTEKSRSHSALKAPKRHHHKEKAILSGTDQSSNSSQEEVTDQREVSQQADQTNLGKKP